MKVLFVTYGDGNASRLRVYNYLKTWADYDIEADVFKWDITGDSEKTLTDKFLNAYPSFDIIYISRALIPENILLKIKETKKIIFDFDDAIYYTPDVSLFYDGCIFRYAKENIKKLYRFLKRGNPNYSARHEYLRKNLKYFDYVVVCNEVLAEYASKYNKNIFINPTPVEKENDKIKDIYDKKPIVIGWIGTLNNQRYLLSIKDVFTEIGNRYKSGVILKIISQDLRIILKDISIDFVKWSLESEGDNILDFDIGIMPLTDDGWSRGKCGYKALQMMFYGIPVVISPVGMNKKIVTDGENGYLANDKKDWMQKLSMLINDSNSRKRIGIKGLESVKENYSIKFLQKKLSELLFKVFLEK